MSFNDLLNSALESANNWAIKQNAELEKYTAFYSKMSKDDLKWEYKRHKVDIYNNVPRKIAFKKVCEEKGIINK